MQCRYKTIESVSWKYKGNNSTYTDFSGATRNSIFVKKDTFMLRSTSFHRQRLQLYLSNVVLFGPFHGNVTCWSFLFFNTSKFSILPTWTDLAALGSPILYFFLSLPVFLNVDFKTHKKPKIENTEIVTFFNSSVC